MKRQVDAIFLNVALINCSDLEYRANNIAISWVFPVPPFIFYLPLGKLNNLTQGSDAG